MSPSPFDHLASAHRRIADAHKQALNAHKARARGEGPTGSSPEIREKLIDAVDRLLAERQVSAITSRDIAREAGLSDGVLYNYFATKNDLVVAALVRRFDAQLTEFERGLPESGEGEVEENLVAYARAWRGLATTTMPTVVGLMSEPDLMHLFLEEIHDEGRGMQRAFDRIAGYLTAEQGLGRLGDFDVEAAVTTFVGSMAALALQGTMTGRAEVESGERVRAIIRTLLRGMGA
ncbi:MAG: TetR/AcrR family transcriptional regulator [Demequinaceae bacterium]|nr:TetR/AcrR family transcriptional regulator [Demequinaceae bacterium]